MTSKALFTYAGIVLLVCATYPLALLGQFAIDVLYGDAQITRDLLYGYRRVLAAKLVDGWMNSLIWVTAFWLAIHALRHYIPRFYIPVTFVLILIVLAASVGRLMPVPPMFGWLFLAALMLHCIYVLARATFLQER